MLKKSKKYLESQRERERKKKGQKHSSRPAINIKP